MNFDTGSSTFWVPSAACETPSCEGHHKYDSSRSSTSTPSFPGQDFSVAYNDDKSVTGFMAEDVLEVKKLIQMRLENFQSLMKFIICRSEG